MVVKNTGSFAYDTQTGGSGLEFRGQHSGDGACQLACVGFEESLRRLPPRIHRERLKTCEESLSGPPGPPRGTIAHFFFKAENPDCARQQ